MKALLSLLFCLPMASIAQPLFTLVKPEQSGIQFTNTITESSTDNVLAYEYFYNGGGVAVGDLNNDGLPDIVFTANMDQPVVYINKGNFVFADGTRKSKIRAGGWKTGVTLADVNADGWLDIYICRSGNLEENERTNLLFINQKDGSFKEMAEAYGVADKGYSTQAAFFDFDRDGDLDLYVLNHPIKRYTKFDVAYMKAARDANAGDRLYRNDGGHFTDVTAAAGISGNPISFGLGIAVADFNNDGWPDLYVSNDYDEDDYLYINDQQGHFQESAASFFGHTSKFSMGCDVGDVNNDGRSDLITLDMLPEDNRRQKLLKGPDGYDHFQMLLSNGYGYQYMRNMLQVAGQSGNNYYYSDMGQLAGVSNTDWSWSALFGDYDLDGWQDLFITNGYLRDYSNMDFLKYIAPEAIRKARAAGTEPDLFEIVKRMPSSDVKNYLFRNEGHLQFQNASKDWGMDLNSLSNGSAYGDFDNDGDLDLVVNNINQPAFVWKNNAEQLHHHYIKIRFAGQDKNPFGIGTKVILSAEDGFRQVHELEISRGFQSASEPMILAGLGDRKKVQIQVLWPDGKTELLKDQQADQAITVSYKHAGNTPLSEPKPKSYFSPVSSTGLVFRHLEDEYNDFKQEPLLPHQYSRMGPALAKADVNGDGLEDLFIGGAKDQAGVIFLYKGQGQFKQMPNPVFSEQHEYEAVDAIFADLDNDNDPDLYVVSGGNELRFQDQIYWNDGKGNFSLRKEVLPPINSSGSKVVALDIDQDGDLDLLRTGQVTTGAYPKAPRTYLLRNDGGKFTDITPPFLQYPGMINSAAAGDLNGDGITDLVLAGEFMPVTILYGGSGKDFFTADRVRQIPGSSGWWNVVKLADLNGDGRLDIVGGNHGLNCQVKPVPGHPVTVDAADLDNNGNLDAIISYWIKDKSYPVATRDELFDQVPAMKVKFPTYQSYANATVEDIFTPDQLAKAIHLEAVEFRSGVFLQADTGFTFQPFVQEVQAFPVRDFLMAVYNRDQRQDLLLIGNNYSVRAQEGKYDAGKGLLLLQGNDHQFQPVDNTGFLAPLDARKMTVIDGLIIVANNNDVVQVFTIH